jgi:nucleotide-binding universal stress UspA family protein
MTRLLIGYEGSEPARAAIAAAHALFGAADAVVAHVHAPPPTMAAGRLARVALPETMIREGIAGLRRQAESEGRETTEEGVALARSAGLRAEPALRFATTAWRELLDLAAGSAPDVIVCGTAGHGAVGRAVLGSTASSLLHHAEHPLLTVPATAAAFDGAVVAGFDGSEGARAALRFAAEHLPDVQLLVAHAWQSPVRHSIRGHALRGSGVATLEDYADSIDTIWGEVADEVAEDGVAYAQELGLDARPLSPESGRSLWRTLLTCAQEQDAAAILVGSRGRGAVAATVLGSVTSGLVHAASLPVLVVPGAR